MPRVRPSLAVLAAVVLHSALSVLTLAITASPWGLAVLAIAALVLPGLLAGYLTIKRPLIVGLCAFGAIVIAQEVMTYILLGAFSWPLFWLGLAGYALQLLVLCVAAVAAYHLRARLRPSRKDIAG